MNVKRYFAKDMQEAMEKIRKELGSDAVILSSKPVRQKGVFKLFSKKIVEVMVAYEAPNAAKAAPRFQQEGTYTRSDAMNAAVKTAELQELFTAAPTVEPTDGLPREFFSAEGAQPLAAPSAGFEQNGAVSEKLNELQSILTRMNERFDKMERRSKSMSEEAEEMLRRLIRGEVDEALAEELVVEAVQAQDGGTLSDALLQIICDRLGPGAPILPQENNRTVVLLLGATGVGKTTTLVKLAAVFALRDKYKVGMINTDTYRISAQEQLKTYAEILGTPVSIVYSASEITQALKEQEDCDIIFIDTAGKRPSDEKHKEEIMQLVELSEADEILLVISASTSLRALETIIQNYAFLENYKLLVTKMDEVASCGVVLNACHLAGMPLSYIAMGQNVPDDIEEADPKEIAGKLVGSAL